jgi:hypothetical protein
MLFPKTSHCASSSMSNLSTESRVRDNQPLSVESSLVFVQAKNSARKLDSTHLSSASEVDAARLGDTPLALLRLDSLYLTGSEKMITRPKFSLLDRLRLNMFCVIENWLSLA